MLAAGAAATWAAGVLTPVLEGLLVVLVMTGVLMGPPLPRSTAMGPLSPASVAIAVAWLSGVYVIDRVRKAPRWQVSMPGSHPGRRHVRERHPDRPHPFASSSTARASPRSSQVPAP